jgi:asparagine synthase (glutamine-hydrolysing)
MCGITGFIRFTGENPESDRNLLERMIQTLYHRGPDDSGLDIRGGAAMGMRRLSIIDLSSGAQPIYNEDRSIWTVFNGEIYNFPDLKRELQSFGHTFTTNTDTEVIVHGYEQWGTEFVSRLNGMFAIALHDQSSQTVLLARDHLGIKPLYYAFQADRLIFGSEIKALLASTWITKDLNYSGLADFISWEYLPGRSTLFTGIEKLLPGELLVVDLNRPRCSPQQYWDIPALPVAAKQYSAAEWEARIEAQLTRSTRMQMISDVPLGAFLSGGVDSSLIVASMGQAQTFSIGFDDQSYNELAWARSVARHLGVNHRDKIIKPDVVSLFDQLMHFMDDPIGDFSIFPTFLVSQLARNHVKVALSGDGGDELFAGYESYLAQEKARWYRLFPSWLRSGIIEPGIGRIRPGQQKKGLVNKLKRFVEGASYPENLSHARWRLFAGDALRQQLFTPEVMSSVNESAAHHIETLFQQAGSRGSLDQSLYVDVKSYLCDNILTKVDRMSMAVSLETRVPFLDKDLVELAFLVPQKLKLEGNETKSILKKIAARRVPAACVYRPKEGFSIPIKHWLNSEFKPLLEDYLNERDIRQQQVFQWQTIDRLKQEHRRGTANNSHLLWGLIVFQDWCRRWLN